MGDDKMGDFFLLLFIYYPLHFSKTCEIAVLDPTYGSLVVPRYSSRS